MEDELATSQAIPGKKHDVWKHREAVLSVLNSTVPNAEQVAQTSAPGKFLTSSRGLLPFGFLALT